MRFMHPEVVATWPKPNYVNPERRGPELFIVNGIFFGLATAAIALRLHTRLFVRKWFGLDDWLILGSWLCGAGDMSTIYWTYRNVWWDRHMWDANPSMLKPGAKAMFPAKIFWACCSNGVRLSLLVLYYRLLNHLDVHNWRYRWAIHANVFIVIGLMLSYIFTTVFACNSIEQYWHWPSKGYCISEGHTQLALSCINTASEALVAALPIPMVMRLGIISRQRISVILLLCLGFLVSVVGGVRCYYVYRVFWSDDMTWYASPHWICSEVEISVAMICASIPAISPVLQRTFAGKNAFGHLRKVFGRGQQNYSERKTSRHDSWLDSTIHVRDSLDDISFIREHNQHKRTVDIEGIGVDGFGYTVTITTSRPGTGKKSTLRKLVFPEEMKGPRLEQPQEKLLEVTGLQSPERSWFSDLNVQGDELAWPLPGAPDNKKGFVVETCAVQCPPKDYDPDSRISRGSDRGAMERDIGDAARRKQSEDGQGYTMRRSGQYSYYFETDSEEESI